MTERELRLCVEGTLSEAMHNIASVRYASSAASILALIEKVEGELASARKYAEELAKVAKDI